MTAKTRLACSVITSSSSRDLTDLFTEVLAIHGDTAFDLYVMRDVDLAEIGGDFANLAPQGAGAVSRRGRRKPTLTEIMACEEAFASIRDWAVRRCREVAGVRVAALATYFPDITSLYEERRALSVKALTNTVRLALELGDPAGSPAAFVELVCGTILDPCECIECQATDRIFIVDRAEKMDLLMESLAEVVAGVKTWMASRGRPANTPFALAAELEPGETYVLNDLAALGMFRNKLAGKAELKDHVGLNLDIAHMRIGEPLIGAADLRPFRDLVVHAHISDHPGMHTRDQVVGRWTSIERRDSGYVPYFELLQDRLRSRADVGLPFSGAVALELEGCNRLRWIIDSLNAMKMIAAMTAG